MLSPADAALVARDPAVPGLSLLLDEDRLAQRLGAPVRRRYLRYKRGTACVLGLDVDGDRAFAVAYAPRSAAKLDKTVAAAPAGTLLAVDHALGVLVARPAADRDLTGLTCLAADPRRALAGVLPAADLRGARLTALSHKPQRRWVGRLTLRDGPPNVVRVHRPADARRRHAVARALAGVDLGLPSLLGADGRRGVSVLTWLPGTGLDELVADGRATAARLRAAGAVVAALHSQPVAGLAERGPREDAADLRRAAAAVAVLVPALGQRSRALAERLCAVLAERPAAAVTAHGDLSLDQVVVADDGRAGLVDLDAVTRAEPALDLGGTLAALHVSAVLSSCPAVDVIAAQLLDGYDRSLDVHRLHAHLAAGLVRRAVEPFRLCSPRWPEQVEHVVQLAEQSAPVEVRT